MNGVARHLYIVFRHMGGFGLLILGALDSSILFLPFGNDLLMIALTASKHGMLPFYASMATAGSLLGCLFTDVIGRKGGEQGLEKRVPRKRLEYVKIKVKKSAGWALALASLLPPPFPFTPFVIAASALQYPRRRLFAVIAVSRLARFSIDGLLAILFGRRILRLAESPFLHYAVTALVVVSIIGSVVSVISWIKGSKKTTR
jgi:membrane protein YqaA with SNARE-associated domain